MLAQKGEKEKEKEKDKRKNSFMIALSLIDVVDFLCTVYMDPSL